MRGAQEAMRAGIALAPEDRKSAGLVLGASVGNNVFHGCAAKARAGAVHRFQGGAQLDPAFCRAGSIFERPVKSQKVGFL